MSVEVLYVHDLAPLPVREVEASLRTLDEPHDGAALHDIYEDVFSTRPGSCLSASVWIPKWPLHPLCSHEHSLIAAVEGHEVSYLLAYLDPEQEGEGYIGQLGVRAAFRRRGLARAMITTTLAGFAAGGLERAALSVAPDNREAIALYELLGFTRAKPAV